MKYYFSFIVLFLICNKAFSQIAIDANQVPQHVGDSVTVTGKIVDTSYSQTETATVYKIQQPNGGTFDVLVKSQYRDYFPFLTQSEVFNKYASIIGRIVSVAGRNRIYVSNRSQFILILGE